MSIVPAEKIEKDPQTLLYHFPSMHPVRYQKLIKEYTFWKHVQTAEKVARMAGKLLVPRECVHWQRKSRFENKRVVIQKKVFFVLDAAEMSKAEIKKYSLLVS